MLEQTHHNLELIVVDDGSTGNTEQVATEFLSNPHVVSHKQGNAGAGSARNKGIELARGTWIASKSATMPSPGKAECPTGGNQEQRIRCREHLFRYAPNLR